MLFLTFWILRMLCSPETLKIWHSRSPTFTSCDIQDGVSPFGGEQDTSLQLPNNATAQ